jgi:hypothetical protein
MREVTEADRVLLIIDENYVERANQCPESGVAIENNWIKSVFEEKPVSWLSVLFVDNPHFSLPSWLIDERPKGFNFNSNPDTNSFPGFEIVWNASRARDTKVVNHPPKASVIVEGRDTRHRT